MADEGILAGEITFVRDNMLTCAMCVLNFPEVFGHLKGNLNYNWRPRDWWKADVEKSLIELRRSKVLYDRDILGDKSVRILLKISVALCFHCTSGRMNSTCLEFVRLITNERKQPCHNSVYDSLIRH